ncbi:DUF6807 family protein [Robertkochia solimangrovi]|uniref:DUF6807 family protein n=1 Tax=Robertkochia solimangrovi TaxID=2213046 RepID=UPI0011805F72|nr:DUF6807 family protein [Robertkochia solimangrovi]TRZ42262.1 hypothetical protein DMZ48_14635 [Robertkochia solimangrovi]
MTRTISNTKIPYSTILLWIMGFLFTSFQAYAQRLEFQQTDSTLVLLENSNPRFTYHIKTTSDSGKYPRTNYIHPLFDENGLAVTEDFPEDHPHHRGIFWTWHQLYLNDERLADPWFCEGITWEVNVIETTISDSTATLKARVIWTIDSKNNMPVIREDLSITFKRIEAGIFSVAFDIQILALIEGISLGGSEDAKGYGGFSVRMNLPENPVFTGISGKVIPENLPVEAGDWIAIGPLKNNSQDSGLIIKACPESIPGFLGWILRDKNSMQNAAFPGRDPILISKTIPLVLKNKVIIYQNTELSKIIASGLLD